MQDIPPRIQQTTDRGQNTISISETVNGQTAPTAPKLPRLDNWSRWVLRWIAGFCLGTAIPSVYAIAPPLPSLIFSTLLILGIIALIAWGLWHRDHWLPAITTILTTALGLTLSLITLLYLTLHHFSHEQPRNDAPTVPTSELSL